MPLLIPILLALASTAASTYSSYSQNKNAEEARNAQEQELERNAKAQQASDKETLAQNQALARKEALERIMGYNTSHYYGAPEQLRPNIIMPKSSLGTQALAGALQGLSQGANQYYSYDQSPAGSSYSAKNAIPSPNLGALYTNAENMFNNSPIGQAYNQGGY
jgi:hypothetical protein